MPVLVPVSIPVPVLVPVLGSFPVHDCACALLLLPPVFMTGTEELRSENGQSQDILKAAPHYLLERDRCEFGWSSLAVADDQGQESVVEVSEC